MVRAFITAVRTLTVLPIPGKDTENFAGSLAYFPFVGAILAAILLLVHLLFQWAFADISPEVEAFALVVLNVLLTGAMHLDGLADVMDALGCRGDRTRMLSVMKDPRVGAFGATALILAILGQWIAVTTLIKTNSVATLFAACSLSRLAVVDLAVSNTYARQEGGAGLPFVADARNRHFVFSLMASVFIVGTSHQPAALFLVPIAWSAGRLLGLFFRREFGGVTGDMLGAGQVLIELLVLYVSFVVVG